MRFSGRSCVVASVLVLTGCSTVSEPDMGFVQDQWSKGIRRLGRALFPVYPPSEDYQVGDIYAVGVPCGEESDEQRRRKAVSIRVGTADPLVALDESYRKRLQFPLTPFKNDGTINTQVDPVRSAKGDRRGPGMSPTPIVAFPEFTVASGTLDKFGGTIATGAFGAIFGASFKSDTFLEVKIKEGSTYGVDAYAADAALASFCSTGKCSEERLKQLLLRTTSDGGAPATCDVDLLLVSRLYQTRHMTFTYTFASAEAFEAAISAAAANAASKTAEARQQALKKILEGKLVEDSKADPTAQSAATLRDKIAYDLAVDLEGDLKNLADAGGNSAFFVHTSYATRSVTLEEKFRRPVVFAYSGLMNSGTWGASTGSSRLSETKRRKQAVHTVPAPDLPLALPPEAGSAPLGRKRISPINGAAY